MSTSSVSTSSGSDTGPQASTGVSFILPPPCFGERACEPSGRWPLSCGPDADGYGLYFFLIDDVEQGENLWLDPHPCTVSVLPSEARGLTLLCEDGPRTVTVTIMASLDQVSSIPLVIDQPVEIQIHRVDAIDTWARQAIVVRDAISSSLLLALYHGPSDLPLDLLAPMSAELGTSGCPFDDGESFCATDPCCGVGSGCYETRHAITFSEGDQSTEIWSNRDGTLPGYDISVGRVVSYADDGLWGYAFGVFAQP